MSNEGKSSRDLLFPELSYLNHVMVSPQEQTSNPQIEMLTMAPTAPHNMTLGDAATVLQDPIFQGGGAEVAETHSPAG